MLVRYQVTALMRLTTGVRLAAGSQPKVGALTATTWHNGGQCVVDALGWSSDVADNQPKPP